jgi:hypothetical protein
MMQLSSAIIGKTDRLKALYDLPNYQLSKVASFNTKFFPMPAFCIVSSTPLPQFASILPCL